METRASETVESRGDQTRSLDRAKESIAYLKLWLGIMVATDISLFAWLLTNGRSTSIVFLIGASLGVGAITVLAFCVHRRIRKQIASLEEL